MLNNVLSEKKIVFFIAVTTAFLNPFVGSAINVAIPVISNEFKVSPTITTWIISGFIFTSSIFMVPFGRLADIHNRQQIYLIGIIGFSITSLLCALTHSINNLIIFRIIQGLCAALIFSTSMAILVTYFNDKERGTVLGFVVSSTYFGLSVGPFLGGFLTSYFGWRSIFYLSFITSFFNILFTNYALNKEQKIITNEKFDFLGSLIFIISISMFLYGFTHINSNLGLIALVLSVCFFIIFIHVEFYLESPIINIRLFLKNRVFMFSNIAALIHYSSTYGITLLLSLYLQYCKNMSPTQAGIILMTQPIVMAFFSPISGKFSSYIEPQFLSSVGMFITAIGLLILSFITKLTSTYFIILTLLIIGFGFALFSTPNTNAVISSVDKSFYGIASAILSTMRTIGQSLSLSIVVMLLNIYVGKQQITQQNLHVFLKSFKLSLLIFGSLCIIGMCCSLARGKVHK